MKSCPKHLLTDEFLLRPLCSNLAVLLSTAQTELYHGPVSSPGSIPAPCARGL
jgi:hypothetical protein